MKDWNLLLNANRRKSKHEQKQTNTSSKHSLDTRTEFERDYDRILFSTPVRRLADKTQVFPLERNDSIRTRLTHSHEVANLARSIGVALSDDYKIFGEEAPQATRNVPALLAATGLAHDLGNPPFGHQGESAIQSWFKDKGDDIFSEDFTPAQKQDFLRFEGNAQTLRILTRLQIISDNFGLNLTYGTLSALLKYTVASDCVDKTKGVASKKFGFFQSEKEIVEEIFHETGLLLGERHPLTYIMEACDDIAYSILDAEDAVKKGIVSFSDLIAYVSFHQADDPLVKIVLTQSNEDHNKYRKTYTLTSAELNDISMQKFRVHAIAAMVSAVTQRFRDDYDQLMDGGVKTDLIEASDAHALRKLLKTFGYQHIYQNRGILEVELIGHNTIRALMDFFWETMENVEHIKPGEISYRTPFAKYVYTRISENYRRIFEGSDDSCLPIRYKQLQLMTDMLSGMTDSFAISLLADFERYAGKKTN